VAQNLIRALCLDLDLPQRARFRTYARLAARGRVADPHAGPPASRLASLWTLARQVAPPRTRRPRVRSCERSPLPSPTPPAPP
jgi:hypothetical protein